MKIDSYYRQDRREILPLIPKSNINVLEVGCAAGEFSKTISSYKDYWGIEPVADMAEKAGETIPTVLHGTYAQVVDKLPDNYFDLVICNDVIEHMPDHNWFLKSVSSKMTPDGRIVGSIPNIRYVAVLYKLLFRKDWRYEETGPLDDTHLRFFTKKSLTRSFQDNGYVIEKMGGINSIFGPIQSMNHLILAFLTAFLCIGTLGYHSDIQYLQFAFKVQKQKHLET